MKKSESTSTDNKQLTTWTPGQGAIPEPAPLPQDKPPMMSTLSQKQLFFSATNLINGFVEGLTLFRNIPSSLLLKPIRMVQYEALLTNGSYLALAMALDYLRESLMQPQDPDDFHSLNFMTNFFFGLVGTGVFLRFFINSTIDNLSMNSAAHKIDLPHFKELTCECEFKPSIPSLLNDPVTNIFGLMKMFMLGLVPIAGPYLKFLAQSVVYGNALIQSRLSHCLEHRREYIRNHVFSVIGYGAAFIATTLIAAHQLEKYTGRKGILVYDAIFTLLYQQFILHVHVSGLNFPEEMYKGYNPYYFDQKVAQTVLPDLVPMLTSALQSEGPSMPGVERFKELLTSSFARSFWGLNYDFRSLEQFTQNSHVKLYITLVRPTLIEILKGVSTIHKNPYVKLGAWAESHAKVIGLHTEGTDLARKLRELDKKGWFSPAYLRELETIINKAAGVSKSVSTHIDRKAKPKELELNDNNNNNNPTVIEHLRSRKKKDALSYDASTVTDKDGKSNHFSTKQTGTQQPLFTVKNKSKNNPLVINDDYTGAQNEVTTSQAKSPSPSVQ